VLKIIRVIIKILIPLTLFAWMISVNAALDRHTAELATLRQQMAQQANEDSLQHQTLQARIDYLTHPQTIYKRSIDYVLEQGEFAK
jgi:hypothetical protein